MLRGSLRAWWHRPREYRVRHLLRREKFRPDYRLVSSSLLQHLSFQSVFDVGCANGFLLTEFQAAGKEVGGIELSPVVRELLPPELLESVEIGDFSQAEGAWDLVCCVEVAEHLTPQRSEELVEKLVQLARRWIYFTAAPPGQTGHSHINCRPHEEWLAWFEGWGWECDEGLTSKLRLDLAALQEAVWLRHNSFLLAPGEGPSRG